MSEFFLTVRGSGSFAVPPFKTHREGVHPITPEEAAAILAWKALHPSAEFITVTTYEPKWSEPDPLTGMLTLSDIRRGTPAEPDDSLRDETPDLFSADDLFQEPDDEPTLAHPCPHCPQSFKDAVILRRHTMLNHSFRAVEAEADARAQLETARAAKAARERVSQAPSDELHPAERLADESSGPARPALWPQGLGNYLP